MTTDGVSPALLKLENLSVEFRTLEGTVHAVTDVSYSIGKGETVAIVGESGSGKSVSAEAIMGIIEAPAGRITRGSIKFQGTDLLSLPSAKRRAINGEHISMIFQDALAALNPSRTVGSQIGEMFRLHRGMGRRESLKRAVELMDRVKIPAASRRARDFPHEFSGGMRQRVMIATAIALDPEVLIADEPTTALDVTVQAQIMELLAELQTERGMGLILISHDLGVVAEVADRILVMYAGRVMEQGSLRDIYRSPAHPYTIGLLGSVPRLDEKRDRLLAIEGAPPSPHSIPAGCSFHPRCPWSVAICSKVVPELEDLPGHGAGRSSACHRKDDVIADG